MVSSGTRDSLFHKISPEELKNLTTLATWKLYMLIAYHLEKQDYSPKNNTKKKVSYLGLFVIRWMIRDKFVQN